MGGGWTYHFGGDSKAAIVLKTFNRLNFSKIQNDEEVPWLFGADPFAGLVFNSKYFRAGKLFTETAFWAG